MAVNVSVRQMLSPDIGRMVEDILVRTAVRPEDLCLELTESVFMEDVEYFSRTLAGLKRWDCGLRSTTSGRATHRSATSGGSPSTG